ncbi:MAG: FAD-dependent oxidoreductase [Leptospiraceae bacterium]|nr:FAD-dependent oxidoreductase [Leptospiraceae bacterium]MBL0265106.1 FAD-dependent oxidoreductase [Leptospiraceae bacterium]
MQDYIVIGAGYGGIAAASLLQKRGMKVTILEAHHLIGGCASYFRRKNFLFDVGATTFSGVSSHQPVGKLFHELEIKPDLIRIDPGMIVKMGNAVITRYSNSEKWLEEVNYHFPENKMNQFWEKIFTLEKLAWEFIDQNKKIPPRSVFDLVSLMKWNNLNKVQMIPELFKSVSKEMGNFRINSLPFRKFIDEQLLITTQSRSDMAPMLTAAMGLAYPAETYYPLGGMYKPAELVLNKFKELNGDIVLKEKVISITRKKNYYEVISEKGNVYKSKGIVSNLTIWNMAEITEGEIQKYFLSQSKKYKVAPGAFTIYFAIESSIELPSLYYQIHSRNKIPNCDAQAFFVSFSHAQDRERAPEGFRTVTISTHTNPNEWRALSKDAYKKKKELTTSFILEEFDFAFPEFRAANKLYPLDGTPNTFEFYTKRKNGFVGGISHSVRSNLLFMTPNNPPFANLYLVGDTVFPGQGIPAVVLGSLNTVNRIFE